MQHDSANEKHQTGTTNATPKRGKRGRTGAAVKQALDYLADNPTARLTTITELARAIGVCRTPLLRNHGFLETWRIRQQLPAKGSAQRGSSRCQLTRFVETYVTNQTALKPRSAEQLRCSVKAFERYLERPARLIDLNEENLLRFISWRRQRTAQETTKRNRANILTLWRFASRKKLIPSPPVEGIQTVKVPKRNPIAWTLDEITKILAACDSLKGRIFAESDQKRRKWIKAEYTGPLRSQWWAALILFIYDTGTRIGATLEIEPTDIDLDRGLVTLRSDAAKTGLEQVLRLSPQAVAAIRKIYDPKAKRVFYWGLSSPPQWTLREILETAGLSSDRRSKFHRIRRTTATLAAAAGRRDLAQTTLGHATPTMTNIYIDKRALPIESAADVLPRPAWGDSTPQTSPETPSVSVVDALRELSPDQLAALLRLAATLTATVKTPA